MSRSAVRFALALAAVFVAVEIHSVSAGDKGQEARDKGQGTQEKGQGTGDKGLGTTEHSMVAGSNERTAVERAFDKQVSVKLKDTPLTEAAAYLSDLGGVNVLLDKKALADAGIADDLRITLQMSGVSLGAAIRTLLAEHELGYFIPADNVLTITTAERARENLKLRVYDVRDLVEQPAAENEFANDATSGDLSSVIELVTTCIQPTSWVAAGGTGSIAPSNGSLVVSTTIDTQTQIAGLLNGLRTVRAEERADREPAMVPIPSVPAEEKIRQQLERRQDVDFHNTPLSELLDYLRAQGLPVSVDQKRLADAGIALDVPLSFTAKQVPLKFAVRTLLSQHEMSYILRDEALVITSDVVAKETVRLGIYPVGDLLESIPCPKTGDVDCESLISLITSTIAPTSWSDSGGIGAILRLPFARAVAISQTETIHEEIADLLAKLRAAQRTAPELGATKAQAKPDRAIVVRVHHVASVADAALDQYIDAIRHLIDSNEWDKDGRFIGKVPGGIAVRNTRAAQERIGRLITEIDAAPFRGGIGGGGGGAF
jgi:hypothetical protein